jgi:hypothetical protein
MTAKKNKTWSSAFHDLEPDVHEIVLMSKLAIDAAPDDDDLAIFTARKTYHMAVALEKKWRQLHKEATTVEDLPSRPSKPALSLVPNG